MKPLSLRILSLVCLVALQISNGQAQTDRTLRRAGERPTPDLADEPYGPNPRQVFDLWKAKSDQPTPLVVYIHGGGFRGGNKNSVSIPLLKGLLEKGVSVMAVEYRLSPAVTFPTHYLDCARAIQNARFHAREWNLDPKRFASTGGSAGAGTSLWIGFHDDLANPSSDDPLLRESTRLTCMAVVGAQSSYDPRVIREWVGEAAAQHPALEGFYGLSADSLDSSAANERFVQASPITHLTTDDPPVWAFYAEPRGPLPANARPGQGIHHINFGLRLKEQMDKLGIECIVRHRDEGTDQTREMTDFLMKHLVKEN